MEERTLNFLLVLLSGRVWSNIGGCFKGELNIWKENDCIEWIFDNFYEEIERFTLTIRR